MDVLNKFLGALKEQIYQINGTLPIFSHPVEVYDRLIISHSPNNSLDLELGNCNKSICIGNNLELKIRGTCSQRANSTA